MTEQSPDLHLVAAALRRDSADVTTYAQVLTTTLADVLPPGRVAVERKRSMADRMKGREGTITGLTVRLGEYDLHLAAPHGHPVAQVHHVVRGVVLSREEVPLDGWLDVLARELLAQAEADARTADALRRLISG